MQKEACSRKRLTTHNPGRSMAAAAADETAQPLLGGACVSCSLGEDDVGSSAGSAADSPVSRAARVLSLRRMLRLGEIAGSLGDLGTFLPDLVSLSNNPNGAYPVPASFVFFSGFWSIYAGIAYDLPMPIQPMHTVVAVSLTEGLTYPETIASGVLLGAMFLILGGTGMVGTLKRLIPLPVVRGLQLGLGLKVLGTGIALGTKVKMWADLDNNLDGYAIGLVAVSTALLTYGQVKVPASLVLFFLGCVGILYARPPIALGLHLPVAPVPAISAADWWAGFYRAALPQLPVTLLNAVVSTAKLTEDLYPQKAVSVRKISLSIAAMDLSTCWFGHFPSCHGCGGLAGQHLFGARTGSSMVFIGLVKMFLALLFGPSLLEALEAFPSAVLGVLLAVSGVELATCCRDMQQKADFAVMLIGAGCVLKLGTGIAFLAAIAAAAAFRATHPAAAPRPSAPAGSTSLTEARGLDCHL